MVFVLVVGGFGAVCGVESLMALDELYALVAVVRIGEGGTDGLEVVRILCVLPLCVSS